jgi:pimeloyl-ACP methyl ester carboxylesterase
MDRLKNALERVHHIPALLLWGDRDRAVALKSAEDLQRYFDRVEFEVLPGTGHLPYEECPEILARIVNSFLVRMRGNSGPHLVRSQVRLA